jgi:hypothetical protein
MSAICASDKFAYAFRKKATVGRLMGMFHACFRLHRRQNTNAAKKDAYKTQTETAKSTRTAARSPGSRD